MEEIGGSSQYPKYWLSERSTSSGNSLLPKQYEENEDVKKIEVKNWEKIGEQRKKKENEKITGGKERM